MKYVPFEPGRWHICAGTGMERWTGARVLGVAQYHSCLLTLLGHLFSAIFRSRSHLHGQGVAGRGKGRECGQAPVRALLCHLAIIRDSLWLRLSLWGLAGNGLRTEPSAPLEGALSTDSTGLPLRERVGQVTRLQNLF